MRQQQSAVEKRGVSPVIGVVLMVAITVVLAATAATFFLGVGDSKLSEPSPTVVIDHRYTVDGGSHVLSIDHDGGDSVSRESLEVIVTGAACSSGGTPNNRYTPPALGNTESQLMAGSRMTLSERTLCGPSGGSLDLSSAEVTVVWIGEKGANSNTLWRWSGPRA